MFGVHLETVLLRNQAKLPRLCVEKQHEFTPDSYIIIIIIVVVIIIIIIIILPDGWFAKGSLNSTCLRSPF